MKIFALFSLTFVALAIVLFLTMDATSVRALQPAPNGAPAAFDRAAAIRVVAAESATLGLIPGYYPYRRHYEFQVTRPESGVRLDCAANYLGEATVGIWALPRRVRGEWVETPEEGSAEIFAPHLTHDFAALAEALERAYSSEEAEQILAREAPDLNCRASEPLSLHELPTGL